MVPYVSKVYLNGSEVKDWTQWRITHQLGLVDKRFSVGFERLIDTEEDSTVTIKDGYGDTLLTLISNHPVENQALETSFNNERARVGGGLSDVSKKGSTKYIWYINKDWLDAVYANYHLQDGVLFKSDPGGTPFRVQGVSYQRLFLPYLPPKSLRDNQILCLVQSGWTQHSIARDLASRIGYSLDIGVPDLPLQRVFVLSADAPYFRGIASLFSKWNPFIYIEDEVIRIRDYAGSHQSRPAGSGLIALSETSFEVLNWKQDKPTTVADHILVQGPDENFTFKTTENTNTTRIKRNAVTLQGTQRVLVFEDKLDYDMSEIKGIAESLGVEIYGEYSNTLLRPTRTVTATTQVVSANLENVAVIKEEKTQYRGETVMHRVLTEYQYADYKTPIGSITKEWERRPTLEGGVTAVVHGSYVSLDPDSWELVLIGTVKVDYGEFVGQTGLTELDIYHSNLLQYSQDTRKVNNTTYNVRSGMKPVHWADQIGEAAHEADSGFATVFGLQKVERLRYDDISDDMVRKIRTTTTLFPQISVKTESETIPIKRPRTLRHVVHRRWEYFYKSGSLIYCDDDDSHPSGEFHPMIQISDMDVIEENTAREIAYRQIAKYPAVKTGGTIKLTASLPNIKLGMSVRVPSCTKKFFNHDTLAYEDITIDGAVYWIVSHTKVAQYSGSVDDNQRTLECYDELELADSY